MSNSLLSFYLDGANPQKNLQQGLFLDLSQYKRIVSTDLQFKSFRKLQKNLISEVSSEVVIKVLRL